MSAPQKSPAAGEARSRRFAGGLTLNYVNQSVVMLAGLWATPFLLHRLGQHDYGLWLVATQILTYLALLDFGIITLLPREIAYITGRTGLAAQPAELRNELGRTVRVLILQLPVTALITSALWLSLPAQWEGLRRPFGLVLAGFLLLFPARIFNATLQGLQDLVFAGKAQVAASLIFTGASAALVYWGVNLYALPVAWTLSQAVLAAACYARMRNRFGYVLPPCLPVMAFGAAKDYLWRGMWVTVSQVALMLLNGTDLFLIGRIFGPAAIVPYAFTGKLITVFSNQPMAIMQTAGPALSEMRTSESAERQLQACNALSQLMLLFSGAIACVILAANQGFISWWVGAERYGGVRLTALFLGTMLLRHWNLPLAGAIVCFGGERRVALTTLADGLVTVAGTIGLLYAIGLPGAPLAAICGAAFISLPANLCGLAQRSGHPVTHFLTPLVPWLWRFLLLAATCSVAARVWTPSSLAGIVAVSGAAASIYGAVMLPVALRDPLGLYLRPRLASLKIRMLRAPVLDHADA